MQEHIKMLDESKKMKMIKKTTAEILGDAETEIIWYTARERLKEILSRYENIPPKEQMHANLIFPHIAVYKSLLENHSGMAMEIMEKGEIAAAEKTVKLFQNVVKLPLGKAIFLKGFAAGCKSGFGSDAGVRHVIFSADSKCYQMDVTVCPYVKYCNAEGCGELTRIF
ncbi:MAG: L-2-amino-thiazoline-4-carboxylic acid hydrolase [Lachnospiraceae bacterium]|nr:L-2-amino-thiazoline-4-carboxylic acid hydrolase [Lachnospiraceae bacterium]